MAETFYVEIITPERTFFAGEIEEIVLQTLDGEVGILKNHTPMVMAVATGVIRILKDGEWSEAVLSEGFMEIKQDKTIIFCDTAEWPHEVDINRAKYEEQRAMEMLQSKLSLQEYAKSQAALQKALTKLKATSKMKK